MIKEVKVNLPDLVHVLASRSLSLDAARWGNVTAVNVWQISGDVEGEGTELLHADGLASAELSVQVGHEGSPNDLHLNKRK